MTIFSRQQLDGLTGSGKGGSIGATGARQKPRQGFGSGGGMSLLGDPKQRQHRQQQQHQQNLEQWQKLSRARTQPIVPQGNTVDEMLKSLQKHPLYNDQNDRRLFTHVSNEYKRAYPGDVQYDEFGKMQRPKPAIQPEQISPFDPDGVLGDGKSRARAAQTARSFNAVTGLINEIDQAGHPERRETTQLQDLGQNLAQSIANIPHNQKMLREGRPEDRKTNPVQVLMGAATGAVGKAAGRFAKGQGASPLLVGLADKGASMAAGMVPGLVGSAAGAIGDAFGGDSGGPGQSAQAQLPNKPSVSMPPADAPSDTMIGWGTGNTAQGPTWSLNKDSHQAMDAAPSAEHAASDMFSFAKSENTLHGSEFKNVQPHRQVNQFAEQDVDELVEEMQVPPHFKQDAAAQRAFNTVNQHLDREYLSKVGKRHQDMAFSGPEGMKKLTQDLAAERKAHPRLANRYGADAQAMSKTFQTLYEPNDSRTHAMAYNEAIEDGAKVALKSVSTAKYDTRAADMAYVTRLAAGDVEGAERALAQRTELNSFIKDVEGLYAHTNTFKNAEQVPKDWGAELLDQTVLKPSAIAGDAGHVAGILKQKGASAEMQKLGASATVIARMLVPKGVKASKATIGSIVKSPAFQGAFKRMTGSAFKDMGDNALDTVVSAMTEKFAMDQVDQGIMDNISSEKPENR